MDLIFDLKKKITDKYGDEIIELSIPTINIDSIPLFGPIRVNQDQVSRLDSIVWSGIEEDFSAIDTLMYANHIMNPFAIEEGDIITLCGHHAESYSSPADVRFPKSSEPVSDAIKSTQDKIKSKPDENRKQRLKKLADTLPNGVSNVAPSNELKVGQAAKKYNAGRIILGTTINTK